MSQGDGDRMTQEYFGLLDKILEARDLSGREVSGHIDRSPPFYSRVKKRRDLGKSWDVVEKGLGVSPRTLFAVLAQDVKYDEILAAFGPQDEPCEPKLLSEFGRLGELIATSPGCRRGEVKEETWRTLEDLERRRFKDAGKVESECRRIVLAAVDKGELQRDDAVVAVGSLGVWSTIRRHANDRGSATRALVLAIRASSVLGAEKLSARLLQRACYLLGDADQYRLSELVARKALELYSNIPDTEGMGMALIDTGMAAYGARELEKAESRLLLGADLLSNSPLHHLSKASAYQFAARTCAIRGELSRACLHLKRAARYAASSEQHWAAIRWCAGTIQFQLGHTEEAEPALREALQVYIQADKVIDIVMILLDLAMVLVAEGRIDEVPPLARHLQPYLKRLSEKDQIRSHVEEAHACLIRSRHVQALARFRKIYDRARRNGFAAPDDGISR